LLNVRSDSVLIAKAESTSIVSCDRAGKVCRYVGWAHHSMTVSCLTSSIGSGLGGADIKALKLSSVPHCLQQRLTVVAVCQRLTAPRKCLDPPGYWQI
jgi:hypothetical protein